MRSLRGGGSLLGWTGRARPLPRTSLVRRNCGLGETRQEHGSDEFGSLEGAVKLSAEIVVIPQMAWPFGAKAQGSEKEWSEMIKQGKCRRNCMDKMWPLPQYLAFCLGHLGQEAVSGAGAVSLNSIWI